MKFLSVTQTAQYLGVSERTVYRLMDKKELHPFKMGKSWKFEQTDIDAYIQRLRDAAMGESTEPETTEKSQTTEEAA